MTTLEQYLRGKPQGFCPGCGTIQQPSPYPHNGDLLCLWRQHRHNIARAAALALCCATVTLALLDSRWYPVSLSLQMLLLFEGR